MDVWCNGQKMETAVCDPFQRLFPSYGYIGKAWQNKPQRGTLPPFTKEAKAVRMLLGLFQMTFTEFYNGQYFSSYVKQMLVKDK